MAKKVLIVDDETQVREFVSAMLEENGYAYSVARDGEEALKIVERDRPDLIIMDVLMPNQSGIKMYRKLKSTGFLKDIPVIIYSAVARRTYLRAQAARWGSDKGTFQGPEAYVEKPARPGYLIGIIKRILD